MSKNSFFNQPIIGDAPAKKKKKGGLRWWLVLIVLFILGGISALIEKIKASSHPVLFTVLIIVGVVAVGVCVFLLLRYIKKKRESAVDSLEIPSRPTPAHSDAPTANQPAPAPISNTPIFIPEEDKKGFNLLPDIADGWALKYKYDSHLVMFPSDCTVADLIGKTGKKLEIVLEPENEYDPGAVALHLDGKRIGYVHKGRLQDMIHDWIDRDEEILCYLKRLTILDAYFGIGFYKPLDYFKGRTFKLIGVTKKDYDGISRAEYAAGLEAGDYVWVFVDGNSYIVTNGPSDFGELPSAAVNYVDGAERIVGRVDECKFNENGKPEIYVKIYPIK